LDTKEIDARLATLQGFLTDATKERDKALAAADAAKETLRAFMDQICAEKNITSPVITKEMKVDQVAKMAISFFHGQTEELRNLVQNPAIQQELLQQQTDFAQMKQENERLLSENIRLTKQFDFIVGMTKSELEYILNQQRSTVHAETVDNDQDTADEFIDVQAIEPTAPAALPDTSIEGKEGGELLKLAGACRLMKLDDLIELSSKELQLPISKIEELITKIKETEMIKTISTSAKPIPGATYPTLFQLSPRALSLVRSKLPSETERVFNILTGITQKELPLFVFAVEDYLPKFGYSLVSYAPEIEYQDDHNQPRTFIPHAEITDEKGNKIYLMFGYEGFISQMDFKEVMSAYSKVSGGFGYFICTTTKGVRDISSRINLFSVTTPLFTKTHFTNINDWATYDKMLKNSEPGRPSSIWFGRLFNSGAKQ